MSDNKLATDSYKGVRDFYPEDAAIQQYIFNTWAKTAESFGFERYDASILEPSDLYRAKGAENEEMVNEQTYTFTDRGDREVTLRPEMTPTVARMVAAKRRELAFPLRWYSIPNLFRYERPQKGRLREHWQLNCDMFGSDDVSADIEVIALAYQTMIDLGSKPEQFEIRINHRTFLRELLKQNEVIDDVAATRLIDRIEKMPEEDFKAELGKLMPSEKVDELFSALTQADESLIDSVAANLSLMKVIGGLRELGINQVVFSPSLARGFDYYTGTIFELFEMKEGHQTGRSMLGGGRYDNLTGMFGGEPVSGVGFGMGDVTMRDFLEAHGLIPDSVRSTAATVTVIPETTEQNIAAQGIAKQIRDHGHTVSTDIGTQKVDKKKARAAERGTRYIIEVSQKNIDDNQYSIKNLSTGETHEGSLTELIKVLK